MTDELAIVRLLSRIVDELAGIRKALETSEPPLSESEAVGCQHPDEFRVDYSAMGGPDEWECSEFKGGCGKRFPEPVSGVD